MLRSALTAILVGAATAVAQLSIYEPTTQHFWVSQQAVSWRRRRAFKRMR